VATKLTDQFYQVSPTEGLTLTITGPADPHVFLGNGGNDTVSATSGTPFTVTPKMLPGMGSTTTLSCILLYQAGPDTYSVVVADDQGAQVDAFQVPGPDQGDFTKLEITIKVA